VSGEPLPALAGRRIWPCSQREPRQQRQAHEVVLAAYAEEWPAGRWQAAEAACGTRSPARMQAPTAQGERSRLARSLGHAKIIKKHGPRVAKRPHHILLRGNDNGLSSHEKSFEFWSIPTRVMPCGDHGEGD